MMRRILGLLAIVLLAAACGSSSKSGSESSPPTIASVKPAKNVKLTGFTADPNKKYTATIATNFGPIVLALDSKNAPKASGRFIELARAGFFDGITWHRVVPDFVIQAGDPTGTGQGNSGNPPVVDVTGTGGYPLGSLAAAKTMQDPPGTFDSQFFIVTGPNGETLDNDYALFGKVISGQEIAKKIEALSPPTPEGGTPTSEATIDKVTITES